MPRRRANTPGRGRNLPGGPDIASIAAGSDSRASTPPDLGGCVELALQHALSQNLLADQSARRVRRTLLRFASFAEQARSAYRLPDIRREDTEAYVRSRTMTGQEPTTTTMHHRRSSLRLLFRMGRLLAWAVAETGARTSEIPHLRVSDVDLDSGLVWVHGSPRLEPRFGRLSEWGTKQIARRVTELKGHPETPLVYAGGGGEAAQASSCIAISATLRRAGLGEERDVRPLSVAAWAGATILARGGSIDQVARALGMQSLDRAARMVGWDWRTDPGGEDQ